MLTGLFCGYSNPNLDYADCFAQQTRLIQEAEALGFDEAWIGERHFNTDGVCPSIMVLLGHLAGITTKIRLGTAMLLLAFRDPVHAAEEIATVDHLSHGRLNLGVAKGGIFSIQNRMFGVDIQTARRKAIEGLTVINQLLYDGEVTFTGEFFNIERVNITPKPLQARIPMWIGTTSDEGTRYAAEQGFGVMGPARQPVEKLKSVVEMYHTFAPAGDAQFNLARFYHATETHEEAVSDVRRYFERATLRAQNVVKVEKLERAPDPNDDALIARSLIGSFDEVRDKIELLRKEIPIRSLLLSPACLEHDKTSKSIADFARYIRPHLAA